MDLPRDSGHQEKPQYGVGGVQLKKRRKYSKEFKKEAVRMARESESTASKVARDLGIRVDMLRRWAAELDNDSEDAFRGSGWLKTEEDELRQLKRELERVKQERDILKKAVAIFSDRTR